MANIAIFASGNGSNFEAIAEAFKNDGKNKIRLLICNKTNAFVLERARKLNVPSRIITYSGREKADVEKEMLDVLKENQIQIVFLAGFMKIFSGYFIREVKIPVVNIHPALLPKHKGAHAITDAHQSADEVTGITIHFVTEEVDSGEMILQKSIRIDRTQPVDFLESEIHKLEHQWYPQVAKNICDKINNAL